jgi:hypothetical protein
MNRIQTLRVLLRGDTPNSVRKLGIVKQTVTSGKRNWWLDVPNSDTGWAAIQIALPHVEASPGGDRRIVATEALGCDVERVPNMVLRDGVIGFIDDPNGDVICGTLATARSEFDARAERVEHSVPLAVFENYGVAELEALWSEVSDAEDRASDAVRAAQREREAWEVIRRQLSDRIDLLKRRPELPLPATPVEPAPEQPE